MVHELTQGISRLKCCPNCCENSWRWSIDYKGQKNMIRALYRYNLLILAVGGDGRSPLSKSYWSPLDPVIVFRESVQFDSSELLAWWTLWPRQNRPCRPLSRTRWCSTTVSPAWRWCLILWCGNVVRPTRHRRQWERLSSFVIVLITIIIFAIYCIILLDHEPAIII